MLSMNGWYHENHIDKLWLGACVVNSVNELFLKYVIFSSLFHIFLTLNKGNRNTTSLDLFKGVTHVEIWASNPRTILSTPATTNVIFPDEIIVYSNTKPRK